jgi:hypothetical protein
MLERRAPPPSAAEHAHATQAHPRALVPCPFGRAHAHTQTSTQTHKVARRGQSTHTRPTRPRPRLAPLRPARTIVRAPSARTRTALTHMRTRAPRSRTCAHAHRAHAHTRRRGTVSSRRGRCLAGAGGAALPAAWKRSARRRRPAARRTAARSLRFCRSRTDDVSRRRSCGAARPDCRTATALQRPARACFEALCIDRPPSSRARLVAWLRCVAVGGRSGLSAARATLPLPGRAAVQRGGERHGRCGVASARSLTPETPLTRTGAQRERASTGPGARVVRHGAHRVSPCGHTAVVRARGV